MCVWGGGRGTESAILPPPPMFDTYVAMHTCSGGVPRRCLVGEDAVAVRHVQKVVTLETEGNRWLGATPHIVSSRRALERHTVPGFLHRNVANLPQYLYVHGQGTCDYT